MLFSTTLLSICYLAVYLAVLASLSYGRRRLRNDRPPLSFEYARPPGQTLSALIEKKNDGLFFHYILTLLFPLAVLFLTLQTIALFHLEISRTAAVSVTTLSILIPLSISGHHLLNQFRTVARLELGLKGEKLVADFLRPLDQEGWHVFHDLPCQSNGKPFNIDHIAVGPKGVVLLETKTRHKRNAKAAPNDYKVVYDGKQLNWPWGSSRSELQQLKRQTDWLTQWISDRTNIHVSVLPILVIPGWWVEMRVAKPKIRVLSHKSVCTAIRASDQPRLDARSVDLIVRQLEIACRITA